MGDFVFNIAKGRIAEFAKRVDGNDPANSAFIALVLTDTGLESDAVLKDKDTVAAVVAGTTNEVTNVGYSRITITDVELAAPAPDDTNDKFAVDIPDLAFGAITAGDTWAKIVIAYDSDTTGGADADLVPCTCHDFVREPDGTAITGTIHTNGFFAALER